MIKYYSQVFPRDDLAGALADGHKYKVIDYDGDVEEVSICSRSLPSNVVIYGICYNICINR